MTFQDVLDAGAAVDGLDVVLVISGIPVAFSTSAGLTFDRNGDGWLGSLPASLTTVEAIGSGSAEGSTLNHSMLMVEGGGFKCTIKSDVRWDKFFQRRTLPKTRIVEDLDATETGIDVQSTSGFSAGDVLYIDREAIQIGTVGAGTFTGCSRVYAGLPGDMLHSHAAGAVAGSSPRALKGRMAELWMHLGGFWRLDRRMVFDGNPKYSAMTRSWSLSFRDAIQLIDRQIAVGLDNLPVTSITLTESADSPPRPMIGLELGPSFDSLPSAPVDGLHAVVTVSNGTDSSVSVEEVLDIDAVGGVIYVGGGVIAETWSTVTSSPVITGNLTGETFIPQEGVSITVRLQMHLTGAPAIEALRVMLSTTGQGDNTAYDDLWGTGSSGNSSSVTAGDYERRFGACISNDLVDIASFEALGDTGGEGFCYRLGAAGSENLRDFLEDVMRQCGAYLASIEGKITAVRLSGIGEYTTISATLSDEDGTIAVDSDFDAEDDETQALHTLRVKCNVDPLDGELKGTINIRDPRTYETFRDSAHEEEVTMRGLNVSRPERGYTPEQYAIMPADLAALTARANKVMWRRQNGIRGYSVLVPLRFITLQPGQVVRVTCANLNAFDGGTLDNQALEVTGTSGFDIEQLKQGVRLSLSDTWSSKPTSPTAKVASWSGGPPQVATLTTNHRFGGGTTPGRQFAVGWKVLLLDASATPPFSTASGVLTVSAVADATVTVTGTVGFTPAAGDMLVQALYDNADNTTANTQGLDQRGHAFVADDNGRLGSSDANADEYG